MKGRMEIAMLRRDEIKRQIEELAEQLEQVERADHYRDYLRKLVETDIAEPLLVDLGKDVDSAFKVEVLRWLAPHDSRNRELSIKDWVITTIGESPAELTPADLRDRFKREFSPKRVASLRQYLAKPLDLVQKKDGNGRLHLTSKGQGTYVKIKGLYELVGDVFNE